MRYFQERKLLNIIVFTGDLSKGNKGYVTYHNVQGIDKFKKFINEKYPKWKFINIYDKSVIVNGKSKFLKTINNSQSNNSPTNSNNLTFDF